MKTLLLYICLLCTVRLIAQDKFVISGRIRDEKGVGFSGVMVSLPSQFEYAITDSKGDFAISCEKADTIQVVLEHNGYNRLEQTLYGKTKRDTVAFDYNYSLFDKIGLLSSYTVLSTDNLKRSGELSLSLMDMKTTPGGNNDVISAMKTLPGVNQATSQNGLFVRGGTGSESKTYIDGLLVEDFFYSGSPDVAQRGRYPADFFKSSSLATGAYSAEYGQALSSVLMLSTTDLPKQSSIDASISTVGGSFSENHLIGNDQSFGISLSYLNLDPYYHLVKQKYDFSGYPQFGDGSINYRKKLAKGYIKFFSSFGVSGLSLHHPDLDYAYVDDFYHNQNFNNYNSIVFNTALTRGYSINAAVGYSYDRNRTDISLIANPESLLYTQRQHVTDQLTQGRVELKKTVFSGFNLTAGVNALSTRFGLDSVSFDTVRDRRYTDNTAAAYLEGSLRIKRQLVVDGGLRYEYSSLDRKAAVMPRSTLSWEFDPQKRVYFSWGHFAEKPDPEYLAYRRDLGNMHATHYIVGIDQKSRRGYFKLEAFYKKYTDLLSYPNYGDTTLGGHGYAEGAEFFTRGNTGIKNIDYTFSYSYINSKRKFLDYPVYTQPSFIANNIAYLSVKRYFPKLSMYGGASYTFQTGLPYWSPEQSADKFLSQKTVAYNNMNLTLVHIRNIRKAYCLFVFTVNNVLGSDQVFGYNYSTVDPTRREVLSPLARRFFYLGFFVNIGINRADDIIQKSL
jgi:vitamin B12 transporter